MTVTKAPVANTRTIPIFVRYSKRMEVIIGRGNSRIATSVMTLTGAELRYNEKMSRHWTETVSGIFDSSVQPA